MIGFAYVLLFTAAGIGAALLALRVAGDAAPVRWMALGFCLVALANLGLHLRRAVGGDAGVALRAAGVALLVGACVWGYARLIRAARRRAARRGDAP